MDFYMQASNSAYKDIKLKSTTWKDAINEVKNTSAYYALKSQPVKSRIKKGLSEYIEVYCGKLRKELTFADLRNSMIYQKIY